MLKVKGKSDQNQNGKPRLESWKYHNCSRQEQDLKHDMAEIFCFCFLSIKNSKNAKQETRKEQVFLSTNLKLASSRSFQEFLFCKISFWIFDFMKPNIHKTSASSIVRLVQDLVSITNQSSNTSFLLI